MIIYGWGDKIIKKYNDSYIQCKQCGSYSHDFVVVQKCFDIFWIPFFPIGRKKIACQCSVCGDVSNTDKIEHYLSITRTPIWFFSGLIIIIAILGFYLVDNQITRINNNRYVQNPKIGDVLYVTGDEEGMPYVFWKIADINQDTIFLYNNSCYYLEKNLDKMDDEDYFIDNNLYYILHEDLLEIKEEGRVIKVIRKYPASSNFNREFSIELEDEHEDEDFEDS